MAETLAEAVRRRDPDRYFTALFAPAPSRETLLALYAFNHELARAPEAAREPGLALIRLQWWREVVEGQSRAHEVATPLQAELAGGRLHRPDLLAMIEAREQEAEGAHPSLAAWRAWLQQGAGSLAVAAGRALGAPEAALDRLRALGAGYGAAGQLRNIPALARQGRCLLPADILAQHGLSAAAVIADPFLAGLQPVHALLAREGLVWLGPPAVCGRRWVAACLPAVFARRDLVVGRPGHPAPRPGPRPLTDQLAVTAAALRKRA